MNTKLTQQNIPSGWQNRVLSDLCDSLDNRRIPITKLDRVSGDVPYYGATGIIDYVHGHIFDEEILLIGEDGADWSPYANKAFIVKGKSWVNNHAHVLKCKVISSHEYLEQYLNWKNLDVYTTGGTRKKLNKEVLMSIPVCLPKSKAEQQKIAEILGTVDEEIAKTQEVIEATEKLKRGLIQQLFTRGIGHTKFKETTLGKAIDTVIDHRGLTPKKLGGEWVEDGIPAISAMNVKNGEIVKSETIRYVDEALFKRWMPEGIGHGDVLLTSEAPLGEAYLVKPEDKYCLSQRLFALRSRKGELIGAYLYYFLISPVGQKGLLERATGSTAKGIRQTELLKISISYPDTEEQKRVAEILSAVDEKISINKKLKEKLTLLKKGLMQDLLSGKVRTRVQ